MIVNALYPSGASFKVPGCPIKVSGVEEADSFETVPLGYNTFEVLSKYTDEQTLHNIYDDVLQRCAEATAAKYNPGK